MTAANLVWRSVRYCSQTIPEALAKFWRAAGSKVLAFGYMVRKLRSIAFQRCIWRGGLPLVEMAENEDFLQKRPVKQVFWGTQIVINWLWSGRVPKILKIMPLWIFSMKSMGHKVSNELWGGMLASILSDRQPLEFFLESIAKKCKNGQFFAFSQIKWDFATASYIQGTTMWKLTSWRLRKCITYWVFKFLNRSYCCSKSDEGEI